MGKVFPHNVMNKRKNNRRVELIRQKIAGSISEKDLVELNLLQVELEKELAAWDISSIQNIDPFA